MAKGIAIFADYGTTKRKIVFADPTVNDLLEVANREGDGNWVLVDELCVFDTLQFECDEVYLGFNSDKKEDDGYCGNNLNKGALKGSVNVRNYG